MHYRIYILAWTTTSGGGSTFTAPVTWKRLLRSRLWLESLRPRNCGVEPDYVGQWTPEGAPSPGDERAPIRAVVVAVLIGALMCAVATFAIWYSV